MSQGPKSEPASPRDACLRIRKAAFRLFGTKGYTRTSLQDIADEADVNKSIVYYYFDSKEALYSALLAESAEHLRQDLSGAVAAVQPEGGPAKSSCVAVLGALVERLVSLARENRESVRFFLAHIFAPDGDRPPLSMDTVEQVAPRLLRPLIEAALQRGELSGIADDLLRLLLGALHYSIIRHLKNPTEEPLPPGLGERITMAAIAGFRPLRAPRRRASTAASGHQTKKGNHRV